MREHACGRSARPAVLSNIVIFFVGCGAVVEAPAQAVRDYISIVGSSTVYPFSIVVAERFGRATQFKTPKVESTGTGGGFRFFCAGVGVEHPDITNASRRITRSEVEQCARNGVTDIVEVKIGYDGIVIANAKSSAHLDLTLPQIYLGLAKNVPDPSGAEKLVPNPYRQWSDIDAALPGARIEVLGPPPTSGTRDAFVELAMTPGCHSFEWLEALDDAAACEAMREDGAYIEAGENDNLIVQKLDANPTQLGIFGYSFLEQNADKVQGTNINGVEPTFDEIAAGRYVISRPLYFYVKAAHVNTIQGIREFLEEFTSDGAWGDFGYLSDRGLIPLSEDERAEVARQIANLEKLNLPADAR
jgi:phosphate transport system substrate-binding protein